MPHPVPHCAFLAGQISRLTRYYQTVIQLSPLPNDDGSLLRHVDCGLKSVATQRGRDREAGSRRTQRGAAQRQSESRSRHRGTLATIKSRLTRLSRVVVVLYNPYFRGIFWLANGLGLRTGALPSTF